MEYYKYLRQYVGKNPIILPGAVGLLFNEQGALLVEKRLNGEYGLPGGLMDLAESFEETLIREIKEETSLDVEALEFVKIYSGAKHHVILENGDEMYVITAVFHVTKYTGTIVRDPSESLSLNFYNLNKLPHPMNAAHLKIIQDFIDGQ